jgi:hypothetical protein
MSAEDEEALVSRSLQEMVAAGCSPAPPLAASEVRMKFRRRSLPQIDGKVIVTVAAAAVLIVVVFAAGPFHHLAPRGSTQPGTPAGPGHPGWIAHSAYGLQLSVPPSWSVQVFGECPDGQKPGTLFIGTAPFIAYCPSFGADTASVAMYEGSPPKQTGGTAPAPTRMLVNGLSVESTKTYNGFHWTVPAENVTVSGSGRGALSVMKTLSQATSRSVPATGKVTGTEYLDALEQVPVTGTIGVRKAGSTKTTSVRVVDGQYWFLGRPGRYELTGHDGDTSCPPVSVVLVSGSDTTAPPLRCNGD